jgi:hypothetical protein
LQKNCAAERVERNLGIIPAQAIGPTVKSFFETAQLADGRPTEIVEEIKRVDIYAHWKRFVAGDEIGFTGEKIPVQDAQLLGLAENRPCPIFARRLGCPLDPGSAVPTILAPSSARQ